MRKVNGVVRWEVVSMVVLVELVKWCSYIVALLR